MPPRLNDGRAAIEATIPARVRIVPVLVLTFGVATFAQNPVPRERSVPAAVDIAAGERAFAAQCSSCHGQKAEGAVGPALAVPLLRRAQDENALLQVIR